MNKTFIGSLFAGVILFCSVVSAQLPANPWAPHPNEGYFPNASTPEAPATYAPEYKNTPSGGDILPVDPWSRSRNRSDVVTWRGSGRHDRGLNYIGEATTWDTAYGQEMIAPEVNRHNMLVMTEHLRNMGYKIPDSYDGKIKNMPQAYKEKLRSAYDSAQASSIEGDPLRGAFSVLIENFEAGTGLDVENLLFNSIDILSTD